jgi:hypothetical protein
MLHVVFAAFRCAALANFGAQSANFMGVCIATRHRGGSQLADIGTCHVSGYASGHGLWVILFQATRGALQTRNNALVAGADAISFFLAKHFDPFKLPKIRPVHCGVGELRQL